jgi:hypothetical protein
MQIFFKMTTMAMQSPSKQFDAESLAEVEQIIKLVYEDNLKEALINILSLEAKYPGISEDFYELRRAKQDSSDIQQALDMLEELDAWELVSNSDGIQTYSKGTGNEFFVKGEMTLHTPIFPVLALFSEVDLVPTW